MQIQGLHPHLIQALLDAEYHTPKPPSSRPTTPPPDYQKFKKILVFDVETTGLMPPKMDPTRPKTVNLDKVPHITQLSFVLYDTEQKHFTHLFNEYIDIHDSVFIEEEITNITGIDRDLLDAKGIPMFYALSIFLQCVKHCDCIVAHNIAFDIKMIRYEMLRYGFSQKGVFDHVHMACTMKMGKPICGLPSPRFEGLLKPPKLVELHTHLFNTPVENLHNAIVDVLVCFRCFTKMAYDEHMPDDIFKQVIEFNI